MPWFELSTVLLMALLGSGHCAGMCGALSALASGAGQGSGWWRRHAAYLAGKSTAYATIGTVLLVMGIWIRGAISLAPFRAALASLTGFWLILVGLQYVTGWRLLETGWLGARAQAACSSLRGIWWSRSLPKSFVLGWFNGFLPCGLSLAAIVVLVRGGSFGGVWLGSFVFGLGTLPSLALATWAAHKLGPALRGRWLRVGGVFLVLVGLVTIFRTQPWFHSWLHTTFGGVSLGAGDDFWCQPE